MNISVDEYKKLVAKKTNKYFAKKTEVDGIMFDSKKESIRYLQLLELEKLGKISNLERQEPFVLHADAITIGKYMLDFVYWSNEAGAMIYEDVKAWDKKKKKWLATPIAKWKKKHVEAEYGINVDYV